MHKRVYKTLAAALLITCITGSTVFADEVTDLKNEKSAAQSELDTFESQLAYLLTQMDDLEVKMSNLNDDIAKANNDLIEAEAVQSQQYDDMKLRIKYMYEDQGTSMAEVLLTSSNMSEILNKTEYVQQVYDYDRDKLTEMSNTARQIKDIQAGLESDKANLDASQEDFLSKQVLLYSSIAEMQTKVDDADTKLSAAIEKASRQSANKYAGSGSVPSSTANNNSATASAIVSLAYSFQGVPYVYGGSTPAGFDCSGFTSYVFASYGISLSRTSGGQTYGGADVGSIANAQPGDIVCYPGHVGIYVGNGMMVHASTPGDVVKVSSVNIGMSIVGIRRYW